MSRKIFVNLPVNDLGASMGFFKELGFRFDQRFTDENAACLVISDDIYAMLLTEPFFRRFTRKEVADAKRSTEAIVSLGVDSRQQVDELVDRAFSAGAAPANDTDDQEFMYVRGFQDLDGHLWEVLFMDPSAVRQPA